MSNILLVTSSPRGDASHSTTIAKDLADRLARQAPGSTITTRDVAADPVPHLDGVYLSAVFSAHPESLNEAQQAAVARSDKAIAEVQAADVIVIGSAMINFAVASSLKAWLDTIVRAGKTFRYGANGPEGLVTGKKVYLVLASGGIYAEGPMKAMDFHEPYLRTLLGFMGMSDVETIVIDGVKLSPEHEAAKVAAAYRKVEQIGATALAA